MILIAGLKIKP